MSDASCSKCSAKIEYEGLSECTVAICKKCLSDMSDNVGGSSGF